MWLALNTTGAYHPHHTCGAFAQHVRTLNTKHKKPTSIPETSAFHHQPTSNNYHPLSHFITNQHPTTITHNHISSPTNIQQLSLTITFHHQPSPNNYHPLSHFIINQHPTTITHHNISSPTNIHYPTPTITFHHQPTPIIQHPTLNSQHKSLWVFQTFSTFAG